MKQLFINRGSRKLSIKGYLGCKQEPCVIINCMEYWEPCDDDWEEAEENDATFYLKEDDIDAIIEKLKEAKEYLNKGVAQHK